MAQAFTVDRRGALLIVLLGVLLLPGLCLAASVVLIGQLLDGVSWAQVVPPLVLLGSVGLYFLFAAIRELRGAWGIRIDDSGIHSAQLPGGHLAWQQVQKVESVGFGVWRVHGPQSQLRISAYIFQSRDKLSRLMKKRAPSEAA